LRLLSFYSPFWWFASRWQCLFVSRLPIAQHC